ncbi:hypothetical protein B0H14DRAFT_3645243 [Mycena olivaceomarginata]|nr:hypothetical protein B0H14DRAFT_3645243 [Mycena olivaceomarginata]
MSILSTISGPAAVWRRHPTHQRAFDEVKNIVQDWRDHHRVALDYSVGAEMINLVTDACLTENKGKRVPRSKQARIGAVSVAGSETASVASTEDSVDAALFGEEGEAEEVPVVDEDVFMTDYTIFKDEDDDAANGGLLTVDGGEAVNVTVNSVVSQGSTLPVDRRDLDPGPCTQPRRCSAAAEVAAPAAARQTPLARPTPHPTLGPADTHQDARGERKVSFASQVKAEPQTKPPQGQGQMQPPPVPGPAADGDDAGDDSFGFFSDDDAFLACVDMGEGDLGQPIDFEEGASSVSVGDEGKAVEAAPSPPQPEAKTGGGSIWADGSRADWSRSRDTAAPAAAAIGCANERPAAAEGPVFTGETAPSRSNDKSAASVARALAIANHCRPSTSNPNQQAPSEPEGGASTGGASTSALPPQQKRPSTPSVCGFHFPPGMPNPLLQNNGRPPPQGVKRGADAMMSSSTRSGAMGLSTSGSGGSTARQPLGTLVLDPQQQHQQGGSGDEGSSPSVADPLHAAEKHDDQWDDRWTGILCAICEDAATIIYDQERAKGWEALPSFLDFLSEYGTSVEYNAHGNT